MDLSAVGLFTPIHLVFLLALAALIAIIVIGYVRSGPAARRRRRKLVAVAAAVLEFGRLALLSLTGQLTVFVLPLELCSLAVLMLVWDAWMGERDWLGTWRRRALGHSWREQGAAQPSHVSAASKALLYSLALPGAVAALITPAWAWMPVVNSTVWQAFAVHALIVAYVLMQLCAREIAPCLSQLWIPTAFLALVAPLMLFVNAQLGTNYMFLSTPAPGSVMEPVAQAFGDYYLLGLAFLVACLWILLYLPWELSRLARRSGRAGSDSLAGQLVRPGLLSVGPIQSELWELW